MYKNSIVTSKSTVVEEVRAEVNAFNLCWLKEPTKIWKTREQSLKPTATEMRANGILPTMCCKILGFIASDRRERLLDNYLLNGRNFTGRTQTKNFKSHYDTRGPNKGKTFQKQ